MSRIRALAWGMALLFWVTGCLPQSLPITPTATVTATSIAMSIATATATQAAIPPTVTPSPTPLSIFGIEMDAISAGRGLDQVVQTSTSWVRRNAVLWSSVESAEGTYDWSAMAGLESELQNASSKGIQVILIVRSTPQWARKIAGSGPTCGPISQGKLPAFGSFMRALVERYSGHPYNVKYWELWNEPDIDPSYFPGDNIYGCWGDQNDAYYGGGYYTEMLKAAYPQIKAADPQAQVLVGGLLLDCDPRPGAGCTATGHDPKPAKFLEGVLRHNGLNDGGNYFDGVSFHAYDFYQGQIGQYGIPTWQSAWNTTGPVLVIKVAYLRNLLTQYGWPDKFLVNTETALLCGRSGEEPPCQADDFANTKAYYLAQSYVTALAEGLRANVWYSLFGWRASGLLNPGNQSPLPAFEAYRFSAQKLGSARFLRQLQDYPGVMGYEFEREGQRIWVLWSLDGASHSINLPGVPLAAWDALGNSVSSAASMNVDLNPLYLKWNP